MAVSGDATGDTHSATVEHSHHGRGTTLPIRRCLESGQACTAGQSTLSSPCAPRSLPICHLDQTHFLQCAQHQPTCGHDFHHVCWSHHRERVEAEIVAIGHHTIICLLCWDEALGLSPGLVGVLWFEFIRRAHQWIPANVLMSLRTARPSESLCAWQDNKAPSRQVQGPRG